MSHIQQLELNCNLLRAILWQHEKADGLLKVVMESQNWIDGAHKRFWEKWYQDVFNLNTATQFGLVVWMKILGVEEPIRFTEVVKDNFGFDGGTGVQSYDEAGFAFLFNNVVLQEQTVRSFLLMRWFVLTENLSVYNINKMLARLFGDNFAFVTDNGDMTIGYTFAFAPSSELELLLNSTSFLPRPAGVKMIGWTSVPRDAFGFNVNAGDDHINFDNDSFLR